MSLMTDVIQQEVRIDTHHVSLAGLLAAPQQAKGVIIFAHGSGSSRFSPRNRHVAGLLNRARYATLLFDLLTSEEEERERFTRHLRFNIGFLAERLIYAARWVTDHGITATPAIGYFGASTGAAAALVATAHDPGSVRAIVSRGGRPDLAEPVLSGLTVPVCLIVGGYDSVVIELNRAAAAKLSGPVQLKVVPEAGHLFEEPGKLAEVARLTVDWLDRYF